MPTITLNEGNGSLAEVVTNLGHVSAYAIAKAHGFDGTEAEWESLIANAAIQGQAAVDAKDAAIVAQGLAEAAQAAAESAQAAAEEARDRTGEELANKVDVVPGKELSTNDYTDAEKEKLAGIEAGAEVNVTPDWTAVSGDAFIRNKPQNLVQDANYVHTDNNFTTELKTKLDGIAAGGQVNVQANWNETDTTSDAYIQNKPENLVQDAAYVHTDSNFTEALRTKLNGIAAGAEVNVNADWNSASGDSEILNKPEHLVQDANYVHTDSNFTADEKTKLAGIETGAEVNVQPDWDQTVTTADDYIKNKPLTGVDSTLSDSSTDPVQNKVVKAALDEKVDKVTGLQLSQNSYTNGEKEKLAGIETGATRVVVDSSITQNSDNPVGSAAIYTALSGKVDVNGSKQLSTEDYTTAEKNKLAQIEAGATNVAVDGTITQNSQNPVTSAAIYAALASKVDADGGSGLSDNNFTNAYKDKLDGVESGAEANVQSDWNQSDSSADDFIKNKPSVDTAITSGSTNAVQSGAVYTALAGKVDTVSGKGLSTNDYTTAEKTKLSGIAEGAEVNVQANWNESDTTSDAYIQNKPANLVQDASYVHTDSNFTAAEKTKLAGVETGAEANVQSDWNVTDTSSDAYIANKPENLVQDASYVHTDSNYTAAEKTKLSGIEAEANKTTVDSAMSTSSTNPVQNKVVKTELDKKVNITDTYIEDEDSSKQYVLTMSVEGGHMVYTYTEVTTT